MKHSACFAGLVLIVIATVAVCLEAIPAYPQESAANSACEFTLREPAVKQAAITGADAVKVPIHVVQQPDSPIEILSVDLTGSSFDVQHTNDGVYRSSYSTRCKVKIRNRSDRAMRAIEVDINGHGTPPAALLPGGEMEVECAGSGSSHSKNAPVLNIYVNRVEFDSCSYEPSARIPHRLGRRVTR